MGRETGVAWHGVAWASWACVFVTGRAKTRERFDGCWGRLAMALLLCDLGFGRGLPSW